MKKVESILKHLTLNQKGCQYMVSKYEGVHKNKGKNNKTLRDSSLNNTVSIFYYFKSQILKN